MAVSKLNPVATPAYAGTPLFNTTIPAGLTLRQTYTSSATFTIPSGLTAMFIIAIGGGGSGGSTAGGGGGGAGCAFAGWVTPATNIVIGAGGKLMKKEDMPAAIVSDVAQASVSADASVSSAT